ncbi:MAG: Arabinose efflux permease [Chthonomonadaceae bacterium]|nr:Arabinose efflux permease [Chthonomonadaceae bacterium]
MNLETSKTPVDPPRTFVEEKAVAPVSSGGVNLRHLLTAIVLVSAFAELSYTTVNMSAMAVYIRYGIKIDLRWIAICSIVFVAMEGLLKSPMGILGDRYGRKILMVVGPLVSVFTALLTPQVSNPYILVFLRILDGVGAAALWPAAFSLIGDHVPENKRAGAMSLFNLAYLLGVALGPALGGSINDFTFHHLHTSFAHSKEASFYLAAVMFAVTAIVAFLMIPNCPPTAPQWISAEAVDHHAGEGGFNGKEFLIMLGKMPMTLLMTLITFLGVGLVIPYFKLFILEHFHLSETDFGVMLIGPALVVAALAVPMGRLGDKIGKARAVQIGIGICTFSFWLLILLSHKWTLMALGSLLGIGSAIAFPAWMALITTECDAKQRGAVVGAVGTAQGLGAVIGMVLSSFLYKLGAFELFGIPVPVHGAPFLGCAVMLTIAFVLGVFTLRDNPHYIQTHDTPP